MKRWNPDVFEPTQFKPTQGTDTTVFVGWQTKDLNWTLAHLATFSLEDVQTHDYSKKLLRLTCHFLLDQIPDRGLDEAFDTLTEIYDFYVSQIEEEATQLLPKPPSLEANITQSIVRPVFPVIEDEE